MLQDIPSSLARSLSSKGCTFTSTDQHSDGSYCPLPNYPPTKWQADINELTRKAGQSPLKTQLKKPFKTPAKIREEQQTRCQEKTTPPVGTRRTMNTPTALQYEQLEERFDKQATKMKEMEVRMKERMKEIEKERT